VDHLQAQPQSAEVALNVIDRVTPCRPSLRNSRVIRTATHGLSIAIARSSKTPI
jgi:hypothetical protein